MPDNSLPALERTPQSPKSGSALAGFGGTAGTTSEHQLSEVAGVNNLDKNNTVAVYKQRGWFSFNYSLLHFYLRFP